MKLAFASGTLVIAAVSASLQAQTATQTTAPAATPKPNVASADAPVARIPAAAFAKRSGFLSMVISPDGSQIATRVMLDGKVNLAILDAVTRMPLRRVELPGKQRLEWYRWAGNGKLLLSISSVIVEEGEDRKVTRLNLLFASTGQLSLVGRREMGYLGDDLLFVDPAGEFVLMALQESVYNYPSVWRFPLDGTATRSGREIQAEKPGVWDWYSDNAGVVRWGVEYSRDRKTKYWYRNGPDDKFRLVGKLDEDSSEDDFIEIERIAAGSDEGYVLRKDDNGRIALRKFNYATRTAGETIVAVPGWDIDEAWFDKNDKPIAVTYTDDRDRVIWLDPVLKTTQARLERAMKGSDVWMMSRSRDLSRMLIWAGHEDDPGETFIYDAAQRRMDPVYAELPSLDRTLLTKPQVITYKARDNTEIRAYLTLPRGGAGKKLPLIVLPHGGPYGVRDKLEFNNEVQFLANRGYAVIQPNYRGSDGFGEAFDALGRGQIGRKMQDDLDDAMDWAVKEGIADPARVCMVGSSYGGYAALWAVTRNPERYRCAASFAGVTDWNRQLKYDANFFSSKGARKWRSRVQGDDATFNLDLVSPVHQIARLTRPVLLTHGDEDTNVPFKQFKLMRDAAAKAGKPIDMIVFEGEGHGFDKGENEQKWLESLEAFLQKHNPPD